jgi:hypothetical protein
VWYSITQCVLHIAQCVLHIAQCVLHITQCVLHITQCVLHITHYTLHSVYYTLHITQCVLHTYYISWYGSDQTCNCPESQHAPAGEQHRSTRKFAHPAACLGLEMRHTRRSHHTKLGGARLLGSPARIWAVIVCTCLLAVKHCYAPRSLFRGIECVLWGKERITCY